MRGNAKDKYVAFAKAVNEQSERLKTMRGLFRIRTAEEMGRKAIDTNQVFIDGLNDDEKAHLVAIAWVGRGAFEAEDYAEALSTAFTEATTPTADYLMGMPHLAENLEAGLEALDIDVTEAEEGFYDN